MVASSSFLYNYLFLVLKNTKVKPDADTPIFNSLLERGDLDFVEQLWVRMRKSESSFIS